MLTNSFGVYTHIPFCVHKCSYCDFYSFTHYESSDFAPLAEAIQREIESARQWLVSEERVVAPLESLFFGGGTPSLIPTPLIGGIANAVLGAFPPAEGAELTLEANPETVTDAFCEGLLGDTPINRVSLGAQSFQAENLEKLERLGSRKSIETAASRLRKHGISNFSLDLIFGIPGQGIEQMRDDIDRAAALEPKHISFYNLTLKPAHKLYGQLPCDDRSADLYEAGIERLAQLGYLQYEISNFAQLGFESRHNSLYWDGGDFLGVGPSASSRFFWDGKFHHRKQVADIKKYLGQTAFSELGFESTSSSETLLEATFLELRKNRGVDLRKFEQRYGYDLRSAKNFSLFRRGGLLDEIEGVLTLTRTGMMLADSVTRDLVDWE